jgi:hypothetical protein
LYYKTAESGSIGVTKLHTGAMILRSISDDEALALFRSIANTNGDTEGLRSKTKLTRKQYYSRMSRMTKAGLVTRKNGKHSLTAFGKVVYDAQATIENAINNYWKLKAVDSIEISDELPKEERKKLLENLIDNQQIREILAKGKV